jgi:hypothetical protein
MDLERMRALRSLQMIDTIKTLATGVGILALGTFGAHADGISPIFYADGGYIDDIEIMGDVVISSMASNTPCWRCVNSICGSMLILTQST